MYILPLNMCLYIKLAVRLKCFSRLYKLWTVIFKLLFVSYIFAKHYDYFYNFRKLFGVLTIAVIKLHS